MTLDSWAEAYVTHWEKLSKGLYDIHDILDSAYKRYPTQKHRPAEEVAEADFYDKSDGPTPGDAIEL